MWAGLWSMSGGVSPIVGRTEAGPTGKVQVVLGNGCIPSAMEKERDALRRCQPIHRASSWVGVSRGHGQRQCCQVFPPPPTPPLLHGSCVHALALLHCCCLAWGVVRRGCRTTCGHWGLGLPIWELGEGKRETVPLPRGHSKPPEETWHRWDRVLPQHP